MSKQRKWLIFVAVVMALLVVIVIIKQFWRPAVVMYSWGQLTATLERRGRVAGESTVRLKVPYHRQEHALSCEVASLKMVLNYFGIKVSEAELIQALPFDPTPRSRGVWGDPYQAFVGDMDGTMLVDGYGVYWEPIAELGEQWVRTSVITQATPEELAEHLLANHLIIIWGYYGQGRRVTWRTPQGKRIEAVNGEHARVVVGFTGSAERPKSFILLDPIYGELNWSTATLLRNWSAFDQSGVVVHGI